MTFFKLCEKTAKISLKSLLILIIGLVAAFSLLMAGLSISAEIINYNYYNSKLKIEIPRRDADFREDTHGGFQGEGDTVEIYELTDEEIEKLNKDIKSSDIWKPIGDELYSIPYLNGQYCGGKVPRLENCWYCFYDKYTNTYGLPSEHQYIPNYIIGQYSEEERKLWIYELDT